MVIAKHTVDQRKDVLLEGLGDFIAELRLVDIAFLIGYIQNDKHANISDLLRSSAELIFRQGKLQYANCAFVEVDWDKPPVIFVDLIFKNYGVTVYLEMRIAAYDASIELHSIEFDNPSDDPPQNTRRLAEALRDARLVPGTIS